MECHDHDGCVEIQRTMEEGENGENGSAREKEERKA